MSRDCIFTSGKCSRPSCLREDECRAEAAIASGNALVVQWRDRAIAHGYTDVGRGRIRFSTPGVGVTARQEDAQQTPMGSPK